MTTVYAPNTSFSGTVAGETFTNGQATVTDAFKLAKFTEWGFGMGSAATQPKPTTLPGGALKDFGVAEVTGTLVVKTGLTTIETVSVSIAEDAAYKIGEVTYTLSNQTTNPGEFTIKVWSNAATPVASNEATTVAWVAYGT